MRKIEGREKSRAGSQFIVEEQERSRGHEVLKNDEKNTGR